MKLCHSLELDSKRNITNYDESWIDSFDPRPSKKRKEIPFVDKVNFEAKLMNIDRDSGILDYLPLNENANEQSTCRYHLTYTAEEDDVSNLTILSKAKLFVKENNINEDNIHQYSSVFVAGLSTTPAERELVSQMTVGQDNNDFWHEKPLYQAKNFGKIQVRMFVKIYFFIAFPKIQALSTCNQIWDREGERS